MMGRSYTVPANFTVCLKDPSRLFENPGTSQICRRRLAPPVFTSAFTISGGTGGALDRLLFYPLYLYQKGFRDLEMGYAAAMAWVLFHQPILMQRPLRNLRRRPMTPLAHIEPSAAKH
jgi:hypothetical protein